MNVRFDLGDVLDLGNNTTDCVTCGFRFDKVIVNKGFVTLKVLSWDNFSVCDIGSFSFE
jgi:hypothetical protein